jgi:pyruvate formate lyase activating enzyme
MTMDFMQDQGEERAAKAERAATILRIQRMSTEDGPGIRSTVFFKGCPLACVWCHNPEGISPRVQVHWTASRCIGCSLCEGTCSTHAIKVTGRGVAIDRDLCRSCLECTKVCPSTALEPYGVSCSLEGIVTELLKDRVYFEKSGGGVTLSGGEPTMQPRFAWALLKALHEEGIHTALDTCGLTSWETLESMIPYVDLVLYDLKEMDPERHRAYTGADNALILENASRLTSCIINEGRKFRLWIRTPLIPGYTARPDNIRAIGVFIRTELGRAVQRWDLCTFNNLCIHKYEELGIKWPLKDERLMEKAQAELMEKSALASGVDPGIVRLSGPMRLEETTETPPEPRRGLELVQGGRR